MNCSNERSYYKNIELLREELQERAYPPSLIPIIPYDRQRRQRMLEKLDARDKRGPQWLWNGRNEQKQLQDLLVFRCEYWPGSRNIRIRKQFRLLLAKLRAIAGENFLKDSRLVIANPATDCRFTKQYALSFVNSEPRRMDRFALYTRFHERRREAWEGCFFIQRST